MIKFFRRIRQQLISENKTGKYLKYAIGEIVLVVIGILIALQINNWNEKRQNRLKVDNLLLKIQKNLKSDLAEINAITTWYATKDSLMYLVLGNKLTEKDYQNPNSNHLHSLIFNRKEINLKNIGFTNLMRIQDIIPPEYERILDQLYLQYHENFNFVQNAENSFKDVPSKFNDALFEKYDWYSSEVPAYLNTERIAYFLNNVRYKGMVKNYQSFAINNYLNINLKYARTALDTYDQISKLLNINPEKPISFNDIETNTEIIGNYRSSFGQSFELLAKNNRNYLVVEAKDTIQWLQYAPNKFARDGGFIRFSIEQDSTNLYTLGYENGSKPFATKIELDD